MKKYFQYIRYICRHKWYVFIECYKLGIIWRGITHDISKFFPSEFFAYCNYFYGGYDFDMMPKSIDEAFDMAWLIHLNRNKHHWQWWILNYDDGRIKLFEMPLEYRKEMLADWIGVGMAIHGKNEIKEWYSKEKKNIKVGLNTRYWIEDKIYGTANKQ